MAKDFQHQLSNEKTARDSIPDKNCKVFVEFRLTDDRFVLKYL